jgi:multiple sugar transport system substrate-binding protein
VSTAYSTRPRPPGTRWRGARLVAAAFAVVLVAAGCGQGDDAEGGGNGVVEIKFSWWGGDSRHEETQQIIDAFEALHENIRVIPDFTDFGSYWDRLATATAAGDAPDVMTQEERYMTDYAQRGQLLDLNEVSDVLDLSDIDPLALAGGELEGGLYAVATGVNAFTIVADPEIFAEAGVDMPDDTTWTWDDYLAIAEEIADSSDYYGVQTFGTNEAGFNVFARQRGEGLYNPDGSLGFSAQTLADWWSISMEQVNGDAAPDPSLTVEVEGGPDQSLLGTNQGAMGFWWTNQLGALSSASGRDLVLLRQPGEASGQQAGMYFKPAMFYSISSQTEHPEEAALFLDFLLSSDEAIDIMLTDRGLPANLVQRERIAPTLPDTEQKVVDFMADLAPTLAEPPPPPPNGAGEVPNIISRLFEEVLFERMTPLEAAEQFMQEVEAATSR